MRHLLTALFSLIAAALPSLAQPALQDVLREHASTIVLAGGKLSGPGAELLDRELASAEFFLIGEDHGMAENGLFTAALLPRAWKHGYRHYAVEVALMAADRLAHASNALDAITSWNRRYPFSLPFLNWREEAEAFATAVKLGSGAPDAVWGLDQEFYFSAERDLDRLAALAKNPDAKRAVAALQGKQLTSAGIETLRSAFGRDESAEARSLVNELAESWRIYDLYFAHRGYENNFERSKLMKRHFFARYDAARARGERLPKVVLKFGSTHMIRGRSFTNIFDLGTTLPELAAMNGSATFQMMLIAKGGAVNEYRPGGSASDRATPYDPVKKIGDLAPVFAAASPDAWTLIDLRAARPRFGDTSKLDPRLVQILYGYDALLVIPAATPAANVE